MASIDRNIVSPVCCVMLDYKYIFADESSVSLTTLQMSADCFYITSTAPYLGWFHTRHLYYSFVFFLFLMVVVHSLLCQQSSIIDTPYSGSCKQVYHKLSLKINGNHSGSHQSILLFIIFYYYFFCILIILFYYCTFVFPRQFFLIILFGYFFLSISIRQFNPFFTSCVVGYEQIFFQPAELILFHCMG